MGLHRLCVRFKGVGALEFILVLIRSLGLQGGGVQGSRVSISGVGYYIGVAALGEESLVFLTLSFKPSHRG